MTAFFIAVFVIYFLFLVLMMMGWGRLLKSPLPQKTNHNHLLSVIIPFRDEENTLPLLIETLKRQDYPQARFEVILVDDHSTDDSLKTVKQLINDIPNFKVITGSLTGKKNSIANAIEISSGEIIVTTDADCELPIAWLKSINTIFQGHNIKMVVGAVRIQQSDSFFAKLQALEFSSLIGSAGATLALGFPTMCNGANLSYRKETFVDVSGFEGNEHITSGDDEFLMRKVEKKFGAKSLKFLNDSDAVVITIPQPSIKDFFIQRIRWAGKWRHNSNLITSLLAVFILLFQLSWLVASGSLFFHWNNTIIMLLVVKILMEGLFLFKVSVFMRQKFSMPAFLLLQMVYPVYVVVVGILSNVLRVSWKDRFIN